MIRKKLVGRSYDHHWQSEIWRSCTTLRALKQIHASIIVDGFNTNHSALRELIFACAISIAGAIDYAHRVFDRITSPDLFMWNTLIRGAAQSLNPSKAIFLYSKMEKMCVSPDNFTFPFVLKACTRLCYLKMGIGIHGRVVKYGFESNTFVKNTLIYFHANCGELLIGRKLFDVSSRRDAVSWSALISGYARRGDLKNARELFDKMPVKDLISWNVMITGYVKQGDMKSARTLFDLVSKKDVVSWNAMISGYVMCGSNQQAMEIFEEMRRAGEMPDEVTILSLLSACSNMGDIEMGKKLHSALLEMISVDLSTVLSNALVDMYAKCGWIGRAMELFRGMREKDVSTWNSLIGGLAFHGHAEASIDLFVEMRRLRVCPNEITFVGVLVACSHAGRVQEGKEYFKLMKDEYNIEPNIRHYGCMVDMYGRAGLLKEAFEFVEEMGIEPNAIVWRTLLGACKVHGNIELGKQANAQLLKLRRDHSGDYVLLSNIYAWQGEWDGVERVRKLMDDSGVRKEVGCSLIEEEDRFVKRSPLYSSS